MPDSSPPAGARTDLVRIEVELPVRTIVTRFPDLRLATDDSEWPDNFNVRGLNELPAVV